MPVQEQHLFSKIPKVTQVQLLQEDITTSVLAIIGVFLVIYITQFIDKKNLLQNWTKGERFSCYWYLITGAITHLMIDGLGALKGAVRPLGVLLRKLDKRFLIIDGNMSGQANIAFTVILTFTIVGTILCLYLARIYRTERSAQREKYSIVMSLIHILGLGAYFYEEIFLNGCSNVCQNGNCFDTTTDQFIYFWGMTIPITLVYLIGPAFEIKKAIVNLTNPQLLEQKPQQQTSKLPEKTSSGSNKKPKVN